MNVDEIIAKLPPVTTPEALEVSRRRADLTQKEAAELAGVTLHRYKQWENGNDEDAPCPDVLPLSEREWCRLQRRRRDLTLGELEELTGFGAKWIHRAERGETRTADPLLQWWRRQIELEFLRDQ